MGKKKKEEGRGEESRPGGGSRCCCCWWRWLMPAIRWCARSGWRFQTAVLPFLCSVFFLCVSSSLRFCLLLLCFFFLFHWRWLKVGAKKRTGGGSRRALRVLGCYCGSSSPPFYSSPGFLSLCFVLFLFSLSGSAGVGSADGGGMAMLLWRWKGNTAVVPVGWGTVLLLLCAETTNLCSSLPHVCFRFLSFISQKNPTFGFPFPSAFFSISPLF